MSKRTNSLLVFSLVFILIIQVIIVSPLFAEDQKAELQEPKVTLEQAITIVKENFIISENLREFTSGFSDYNNRQFWSLSWSSNEEGHENFSAQVDAVSGEIVNIYSFKPTDSGYAYKLPALSLADAKVIADNMVKKLTGQKYGNLRFVETNSVIPLDLHASPAYSFGWERRENGIAVQGNGVRIQIDGNNGQVISYSFNWYTLNLPKPENISSAEQAALAFNQAKMLEMQYFLAPAYKIMTAGIKEQVQLVYQLNNNGLIDAVTGKPLVLKANQYLAGDEYSMGRVGNGMTEDARAKSVPLTPQEQKEVDENTKLLTQADAIKVIQKWVEIPSGLTLRTMNLNTDRSIRDTKVWYFEWSSSAPNQFRNIAARVDAVNGELIGFNFYSPRLPLTGSAEPKAPLTKQGAQAKAEDFLNKIQPDKFKQTRLKADPSSAATPAPVLDTPVDSISVLKPEGTSASFYYERVVNGIAFPSNGMTITVDLTTQNITAFHLTWYSLDFPPLSQALSQTKAEEAFLKSRPMVLQYVLVYNNGEVSEAKLGYLPLNESEGNQVSDIMDAQTGVFLNWLGKPLNVQPKSYHFADIAGLEAEKEMTVLGQAGIFGEYQNAFRPAENITAESFFRALHYLKNGTGDYQLSPEEIIKKAKDQGWLKEEMSPAQYVSREMHSKVIVRYLGLEKIAELKDIYQPAFQDVNNSQGYIALTTGLGIMKVNGQNFEPGRNVTRAEAASALIKALGNKRY